MFSLLVGLGIALSIRLVESKYIYFLVVICRGMPITLGEDTAVINLTFIFLLITLLATLIVLNEFHDNL